MSLSHLGIVVQFPVLSCYLRLNILCRLPLFSSLVSYFLVTCTIQLVTTSYYITNSDQCHSLDLTYLYLHTVLTDSACRYSPRPSR